MINIIVGTNRPDSNSATIAAAYLRFLREEGIDSHVIDLAKVPQDFISTDMYGQRSEWMKSLIERSIAPAEKLVFIIPEYNGGFPGVLKAFVDCIEPKYFHGKKAGLVGLSSGHAGSLRGMDQFSNVLNYLRVNVLHAKPKLSYIEKSVTAQSISDERSLQLIKEHVILMLNF